MSDNLKVFSSPDLKDIVQDMRELLSQSRLAFLIGAGCSKIAGLPLMSELTEEVLKHEIISDETKKLLERIRALFTGTDSATIEDYMSEIVDLLSIAERRKKRGAKNTKVQIGEHKKDANELQKALEEIKNAISSAIGDRPVDVMTHQLFVKAIHGSLQSGKPNRLVDYFILNYDTLIEDALGIERIDYCDGFTGSATGWWKASTYNSDKKNARIFKIHGSIDWCLLDGDTVPRRIRSGIKKDSMKTKVLIYPAATKYLETQRDPFAQMLHYMRQSLQPDNRAEMVLAINGYGFEDSHINLEIENALYESEGRLTVAAFVSTDKPEGELQKWLTDRTISEQIRVYANRGFFHGDIEVIWDDETTWWKFEVLARLLGGER